MSIAAAIKHIVAEPPATHLFELSEEGVAFASAGWTGFQPLEPGVIEVSPVEDNLRNADRVALAIEQLSPSNGHKKSAAKKRRAAVILPDYAARVSVLDFDSFPSSVDEQGALVRFRVKKTIPYEIESAAVSYYIQAGSSKKKKIEVVTVTVAVEIIARYEALFRNAGFQPGVITISALAALNLYRGGGLAVIAKLNGRTLTVMVTSQNTLKLFRCVLLEEASEDEILSVLRPTFAYVEDELGAPAEKLYLCGVPELPDIPCAMEPLRGRFGTPGPFNAGLLGYLESEI